MPLIESPYSNEVSATPTAPPSLGTPTVFREEVFYRNQEEDNLVTGTPILVTAKTASTVTVDHVPARVAGWVAVAGEEWGLHDLDSHTGTPTVGYSGEYRRMLKVVGVSGNVLTVTGSTSAVAVGAHVAFLNPFAQDVKPQSATIVIEGPTAFSTYDIPVGGFRRSNGQFVLLHQDAADTDTLAGLASWDFATWYAPLHLATMVDAAAVAELDTYAQGLSSVLPLPSAPGEPLKFITYVRTLNGSGKGEIRWVKFDEHLADVSVSSGPIVSWAGSPPSDGYQQASVVYDDALGLYRMLFVNRGETPDFEERSVWEARSASPEGPFDTTAVANPVIASALDSPGLSPYLYRVGRVEAPVIYESDGAIWALIGGFASHPYSGNKNSRVWGLWEWSGGAWVERPAGPVLCPVRLGGSPSEEETGSGIWPGFGGRWSTVGGGVVIARDGAQGRDRVYLSMKGVTADTYTMTEVRSDPDGTGTGLPADTLDGRPLLSGTPGGLGLFHVDGRDITAAVGAALSAWPGVRGSLGEVFSTAGAGPDSPLAYGSFKGSRKGIDVRAVTGYATSAPVLPTSADDPYTVFVLHRWNGASFTFNVVLQQYLNSGTTGGWQIQWSATSGYTLRRIGLGTFTFESTVGTGGTRLLCVRHHGAAAGADAHKTTLFVDGVAKTTFADATGIVAEPLKAIGPGSGSGNAGYLGHVSAFGEGLSDAVIRSVSAELLNVYRTGN